MEHIQLFLPCTEYYFKLIGEFPVNMLSQSYAQPSMQTGGILSIINNHHIGLGRLQNFLSESPFMKRMNKLTGKGGDMHTLRNGLMHFP
jgi:hypothetical protein